MEDKMNRRELDVLSILWRTSEPKTAIDIVKSKSGLTQSTVTAVLRKLLENELVEVVGVTHSGRVLSRTYKATEKAKQVVLDYFIELYREFKDVASQEELISLIKNL